ncbi:MAG: hypothetical protein AAFN77_18145 [Planctomycetota bacterium]
MSLKIEGGSLQRVIEHEMALVACCPIISRVDKVSQLYEGFVGSNQLNEYFSQEQSGSANIHLVNGSAFLRSQLRFYVFSLARRNVSPGSIAFGYFRGLMKAIELVAERMEEVEDSPGILETIVLYFFQIYSDFDLDTRSLEIDHHSIGGALSCFSDDIRRELRDPKFIFPEIDRNYIIDVAKEFALLWFVFNQEEVLEKLHEVVA